MADEWATHLASLVKKYGPFIKCDAATKRDLFADFIEAGEDIDRIGSLVSAVGKGTLPRKNFYRALLKVSAWSWHLADHLNAISKVTIESDFDSRGKHGVKRKARKQKRSGR